MRDSTYIQSASIDTWRLKLGKAMGDSEILEADNNGEEACDGAESHETNLGEYISAAAPARTIALVRQGHRDDSVYRACRHCSQNRRSIGENKQTQELKYFR